MELRMEVSLARPALAESIPDFDEVYDSFVHTVLRWVDCMGAGADAEDLTQEIFVIVDRKLADFDGRNLAGWLYGITRRVVGYHRRRAWLRSLLFRTAEPLGS